MAHLTSDDVLKLARLARLRLTDDEIKSFQGEINAVLGYVEMLQDADTDNLKPTAQVTGLSNVMRADEIIAYGPTKDNLLSNAPGRDGAYVKTKRIL